jgi:hypothetical protein
LNIPDRKANAMQISDFQILGMSGRNDEHGHYAEVIAFRLPSAEAAKQLAIFMTQAVTEALARQEGTELDAPRFLDTTETH